MKCEFCGLELDEGTKVCAMCGFVASRPVMTEKTHHVVDFKQQRKIDGNLSSNEYKINQTEGFSQQNIKEEIKPKKNADLQKNQGVVQPMQFMVQGQSAKSVEQVHKKNSSHHYIEPNQQSGAPQKQFNYKMPVRPVAPEKPTMTRNEFFNYRGVKKSRNFIFSSIILLYIYVVYFSVTEIFMQVIQKAMLSLDSHPWAFIDVVFILAMLLLVQFKQSFKASVALGIYTFLILALNLLLFGELVNVLLIVAVVLAIVGTNNFNKQWKIYQNTGILPDEK